MAKSPDAFRSIGEVARAVGVAPHVLRYWEQQFAQLAPVKRADGRRYYRPEDVYLAAGLSQVLREEGLSIRGARRLIAADRGAGLRQVGAARLARGGPPLGTPAGEAGEAAEGVPPGIGVAPGAIRLGLPGAEPDRTPEPAAPAPCGPAPPAPAPTGPGGQTGGEAAAASPPRTAPPPAEATRQLPLFGANAGGRTEAGGQPAAAEVDPWLARLNALARALELAALDEGAPRGAGAISRRLRGLLARRAG